MSVVFWFARVFPEAPIKVSKKSPDGPKEILNHPMVELLEFPNAFYSGELLWRATTADRMITGNAYWLKVRSDMDRVLQLWWIPSWMIEPKWDRNNPDGSKFITHYEYLVDGRKIEYEVRDIVHFRHGLDSTNMRKGFSPVSLLTREIFTDDEAAHFTASILNNLGMPGVIIAPDSDKPMQADPETIKQKFEERFTGDNRGRALVLTAKTQVHKLSFSPEELNVRNLRRIPEERATAIYGIPAVVVGLGAGLDRSTFANMAEAREAAYESNVIPEYRLYAADLRLQLLPDFVGDEQARNMVVEFDTSGVRVLQEDQNALFTRLDTAWNSGWAKRSEVRAAVGWQYDTEDEVYKSEATAPEEPELDLEGQEGGSETDEEERTPLDILEAAALSTNGIGSKILTNSQ